MSGPGERTGSAASNATSVNGGRDVAGSIGSAQRGCLDSVAPSGNAGFAVHLARHFPEVAARIDDCDFGVLHLEVGALKLATRDAIAKRDWHTVCNYFNFVADLLAGAGDELRDAVNVSYLGNLFYGETSPDFAKARTLLPKPLAEALAKIESHFEDLVP